MDYIEIRLSFFFFPFFFLIFFLNFELGLGFLFLLFADHIAGTSWHEPTSPELEIDEPTSPSQRTNVAILTNQRWFVARTNSRDRRHHPVRT